MEDKLLNEEHAAAQTAENYRRVCDEIAEAAYKAGAILPKFGLWAQQNSKPARRYCLCSRPGLRRSAKIARRNFAINSIFSPRQGVRPHFIGALQTNKAKYVVGKAELIQSVVRLRLPRK